MTFITFFNAYPIRKPATPPNPIEVANDARELGSKLILESDSPSCFIVHVYIFYISNFFKNELPVFLVQ
jgi:hypothetical protein